MILAYNAFQEVPILISVKTITIHSVYHYTSFSCAHQYQDCKPETMCCQYTANKKSSSLSLTINKLKISYCIISLLGKVLQISTKNLSSSNGRHVLQFQSKAHTSTIKLAPPLFRAI